MALSGKHILSDINEPISSVKRSCLMNLSGTIRTGINSKSSNVNVGNDHKLEMRPRINFLLSKHQDSSDEYYDSDVSIMRHRPMTHFSATTVLNPNILNSISRYSDFENYEKNMMETHYTNHSSSLPLKKNVSRHPSFAVQNRQKYIPRVDFGARERCFDYILQSIDEVWSRYCSTTSTAENKVYDCLGKSPISQLSERHYFPVGSENFSEDDDFSDSDYKSEITNPTEYETDCDHRKVSSLPQSVKLQSLKDRLTKAKKDLENFYDSPTWVDCKTFWRRWDMIKYSAVEMMEEDDDDEIIETIIQELEEGRCYLD